MTVTVALNEITGMWRHYQWCEVLQTQVFLQSLYRPGKALRVARWLGLPDLKAIGP